MRSVRALLLLASLAASGCARGAAPAQAPPLLESLLGTYELVSILGKPLPVREFQAVYFAGELTLHRDQLYVSHIDAETCTVDNVCERAIAATQGVWVILPDGSIEFDPHDDSNIPEADRDPLAGDVPPPRIVADGREIRYYTRSETLPIFTYRRR